MSSQPSTSLHRFDTNLLVVLDILLEEKSATVAAQHLGITRSAVSHALRRLRELLDDPILVRGDSGLTLSPLAMQLRTPLRRTLGQLENLLEWKVKFDPATHEATFTIGAGEWFARYALPGLLDELSHQAPGMQLRVVPLDTDHFVERMANGDLDLAIGAFEAAEPELSSVQLVKDRLVGVVRNDHPFASEPPTPEAYASATHAVVAGNAELVRAVVAEIRKWKEDARIAFTLPYVHSVPFLLEKRDLVITMSRALAIRLEEDKHPITIVEPPFATPERLVKMTWHRESGQAPAQQWLRQRIISLLAVLASRWSVRWEHG